jgi:hypothetical protein
MCLLTSTLKRSLSVFNSNGEKVSRTMKKIYNAFKNRQELVKSG